MVRFFQWTIHIWKRDKRRLLRLLLERTDGKYFVDNAYELYFRIVTTYTSLFVRPALRLKSNYIIFTLSEHNFLGNKNKCVKNIHKTKYLIKILSSSSILTFWIYVTMSLLDKAGGKLLDYTRQNFERERDKVSKNNTINLNPALTKILSRYEGLLLWNGISLTLSNTEVSKLLMVQSRPASKGILHDRGSTIIFECQLYPTSFPHSLLHSNHSRQPCRHTLHHVDPSHSIIED